MKYMGSKARIAKEILPIILKDRKPEQYYVEPFCGGCNMIDKVANPRIANDIHPQLIALLKALSDGWEPPREISEEQYIDCKKNQNKYDPVYVGYVGFCLSYSGKWWGGYARDKAGKRNYGLEAYKNLLNQQPLLKDIEFHNRNYYDLDIPHNSIIYCDPPYFGTTKYKNSFDNDKFWCWCERQVKIGNRVFVSEYQAPNTWRCVWQKEITSSLTQDTGSKKAIERLFTL